MKNLLIMFFTMVFCISLMGCAKIEGNSISDNADGMQAREVVSATVALSRENNKTFMEVEIIANGSASGGSESWQKDEEISFTVKSSKKAEIEIGIVPVLENGDYGEVLSQVCEISEREEKISIKVPADGEYGICFINKGNTDVSFQAEINTILENPFV